MSREKDAVFDKIIERICEIVGTKASIANAAKALSMSRQGLQSHKTRNTLPERQIYRFSYDSKASADWLLYGKGEKWLEYSEGAREMGEDGEYHIGDPELRFILDTLRGSQGLKKEFYKWLKEGGIGEYKKEIKQSQYKDSRLAALIKKLEAIYKEGRLKERAEVRGIIEEVYDEVVGEVSLPEEEEELKVGFG